MSQITVYKKRIIEKWIDNLLSRIEIVKIGAVLYTVGDFELQTIIF